MHNDTEWDITKLNAYDVNYADTSAIQLCSITAEEC